MCIRDRLTAINRSTWKYLSQRSSPVWVRERLNYGGTGKTLTTIQWEGLLARMEDWSLKEIRERRIFVGEWICSTSFSGKTCDSGDGWLIAIPSGLMMSIYQVSRTIAAWIPVDGTSDPVLTEEDACREIGVAMP